ncbi:unnamed protein product [Amoebophrya sp. A25]|nr:unnamed protein product [Amoebophrya sp. A25]|eukprot:GSA25T00005928001.1
MYSTTGAKQHLLFLPCVPPLNLKPRLATSRCTPARNGRDVDSWRRFEKPTTRKRSSRVICTASRRSRRRMIRVGSRPSLCHPRLKCGMRGCSLVVVLEGLGPTREMDARLSSDSSTLSKHIVGLRSWRN